MAHFFSRTRGKVVFTQQLKVLFCLLNEPNLWFCMFKSLNTYICGVFLASVRCNKTYSIDDTIMHRDGKNIFKYTVDCIFAVWLKLSLLVRACSYMIRFITEGAYLTSV